MDEVFCVRSQNETYTISALNHFTKIDFSLEQNGGGGRIASIEYQFLDKPLSQKVICFV